MTRRHWQVALAVVRPPPIQLIALLTAALACFGCSHTQRPERKIYVIAERESGTGRADGPGTGGAGAEAYCAELQLKCHARCKRRAPKYPGIKKGSPDHDRICTSDCLAEFMACLEEQEELERQELEFSNIDAALDWLRRHKTEVALGTVVVVAGVTFIVATGGTGALILAPLAL
jgi:hypothetical protein